MTREELNTSIDDNIVNATLENKITPTKLGVELKKIANYSESIVVSKIKKTSVNASQILSIFDTPVEIIPAPGAGKMIIPQQIIIVIRFNTTTYSNPGGAWRIMIGNSPIQLTTMTSYIAAATFDKETIQTLFYSALTTSGTFINAPLLLTTTSSNPIGGDSGIDVYVAYDEIKL